MSSHLYWGIGTPPQCHERPLLTGRQIRHLLRNKTFGIGQWVSESQRPHSANLGALGREDEDAHQYVPKPDDPCGRIRQ